MAGTSPSLALAAAAEADGDRSSAAALLAFAVPTMSSFCPVFRSPARPPMLL